MGGARFRLQADSLLPVTGEMERLGLIGFDAEMIGSFRLSKSLQ